MQVALSSERLALLNHRRHTVALREGCEIDALDDGHDEVRR